MNYKFRGKTSDSGEWIYGNLIVIDEQYYILEQNVDIFELRPDYNSQALGCGIEDNNIDDRYEAGKYGFDKGVESTLNELWHNIRQVNPESVGQFTGIREQKGFVDKDKDDWDFKDIYSGDIIKVKGTGGEFISEVVINPNGVQIYDDNNYLIRLDSISSKQRPLTFKILGNKTDNPEYLKEEGGI